MILSDTYFRISRNASAYLFIRKDEIMNFLTGRIFFPVDSDSALEEDVAIEVKYSPANGDIVVYVNGEQVHPDDGGES